MPSHNVLITNVDVLTPKGVTNSSIAIADGRFVGVGDQPADFRADETIDGTNMFAMPGFLMRIAMRRWFYFVVPRRICRLSNGSTTESGEASRR